MRALLTAAALLTVFTQAMAAEWPWTVYSSPRFELLTNGDPSLARAALGHLETVAGGILRNEPWLAQPPGRVRILAFSSEKEFEPYRSSSQSPAYFAGGPEGGLIVLGRLAKEYWPCLAHEYVHAAIRAPALRLPLWLEEGLAELYSGRPAPAEEIRLSASALSALESPVPQGPGVRAVELSNDFYRQSRLLVHVLRHHPGYAPQWPIFLRRAAEGLPLAENVERAGRTPGQLARDASRFRTPYPVWREPGAVDIEAAPLDRAALRWTRALALARLGRVPQALEQIVDVDTAEAHALAGRLLHRRDDARALARLRRAFELGSRDPHALWRLIVLEQDTPGSAALVPALERLLEVEPGRDEARLLLASHYLARGQRELARLHFGLVRSVPAEHTPYYRRALALIGPA